MWVAKNYDGDYVLSKHKLVRVVNDDYHNESYWEFESCVDSSEEDNDALFGDKQDIYKNILEDLFPDLTWNDEPVEVKISVVEKKTKNKNDDVYCFQMSNEDIYSFRGCNPTFEKWVNAGIALGYGQTKDDFDYYDYLFYRGDFNYTR